MTLAVGQASCMPALFGPARFGATRFGCMSGRAFIAIGGIVFPDPPRTSPWQPGVLYDSVRISDLLNERPNTCTLTVWGARPAVGASVDIVLGSINNQRKLFAGLILDVQQTPGSKPANLYYHVSAIDRSWLLNQLTVSELYRSQSATAIVLDLVAKYAPWVTTRWVVPNLPPIDEITFTNENLTDCFARIVARIGGYFYLDYLSGLHAFLTEEEQAPLPLTPTHPSLRNVGRRSDLSQMVTRALVEGGGVNALAEIPAGETILPVEDDAWYAAGGGTVVSGPQRITYTGVIGKTGAGSLVGPGVTPTGPPTVALVNGAGIESGVHSYAYSWITAAGETRPGPVASVTHGTVPAPTVAPTYNYSQEIGWSPSDPYFAGDSVRYAVTYSLADEYGPSGGSWLADGQHTPLGPILTVIAQPSLQFGPPYAMPITFTVTLPTDPRPQAVHVWRSVNGGPWNGITRQGMSHMVGWISWPINNEKSPITFATNVPAAANALNQSAISGISIGPAGVTARKLYRTAANGSQLKLLQTLANNTATTATDAAADATLGANAPAGDTSGLTSPAGQVNPGSPTMIVASTSWAAAAGGWAVIGNGEQAIRYTGISGNQLTGIPASGPGAIVAAVSYNSTITGAPCLIGIPATGAGAIRYLIKLGDPVNLLAIVDDLTAQSALAALIGGTGVIEDYAQDRRLGLTEATARAQALLRQRSTPQVTLTWISRDVNTHSGGTIVANLPAPTDIHDTLKIQTVVIDRLSPDGDYPPTYHVTASSEMFTLDDLLRQARIEDRSSKVIT